MELSLDQVTIVKPITVNHENSKLYSMLKQCMENNAILHQEIQLLQMELVRAAETIDKLTYELSK